MFGIDDTLLAGGTSLAGGLLGSLFSGQGKDFYTRNDEYYNMGKEFLNPNSMLYQSASKGFYNKLNDASPTLNTLLGFAKSQGLSGKGSMAIAKAQRDASQKQNTEAASNFQSDLFGRGWSAGTNLLGMDQQSRMAYAAQSGEKSQGIAGQFMNAGAGLLGMYFGNNSGRGNSGNGMLDPNYFSNLGNAPRQNFSNFSFGGRV